MSLRTARIILSFLSLGLLPALSLAADSPPPDSPDLILKTLRSVRGFKVDLIAKEPQLKNPVSFSIDELGRIYVAETYRLHHGVTDIRGHMDWLLDDLACRTIADEERMLRKRVADDVPNWSKRSDQVRLLEDRDGDGKIDTSSVYADEFSGLVTGIGAGVLASRGSVWYTNIPSLWRLGGLKPDGHAETRTALSTGYGVHVSFIGHDLHGLTFGPDGRIYFSMGDRGLHVETKEGVLHCPDTGAVLRCEPDGSHLEIYAHGLRNPQELTFDQFGNLWTGDNNSDGGDKARLVNIVEGGDSGWRIGYQSLEDRGPWNGEKLWHEGDNAASQIPPVAHVGHGPSGIAFYPGTGLPPRYDDHFFLCDFPGGVLSFKVEPSGSGFRVWDLHQFLWEMYATDVDFSPSGGVYVLDWVYGWEMPNKGRIFHVYEPGALQRPLVAQTRELIAQDFGALTFEDLARLVESRHLLSYRDRRVRQAAQFALAAQGMRAVPFLRARAGQSGDETEQLHVAWALGQIARREKAAGDALAPLLDSSHAEVRGAVAEIIGDCHLPQFYESLCKLLKDPWPRTRFHAAMALSKLGRPEALPAIVALLRESRNQDPYIRHAGVMALTRLATTAELLKTGQDESAAIRLAVALALRRLERSEIASFVTDKDAIVALEAARAINDVPIEAATAALAGVPLAKTTEERVIRRVLHANYRIGTPASSEVLVEYAARSDAPEGLRVFALHLLANWAGPAPRDAITGAWRPMAVRASGPARDALLTRFDALLLGPASLQTEAIRAAASLQATSLVRRLEEFVRSRGLTPEGRSEALRTLSQLQASNLPDVVLIALRDPDLPVARQAIAMLADSRIPDSLTRLAGVIFSDDAPISTRQAAIDALAAMKTPSADPVVLRCVESLIEGRLPPALHLNAVECAARCAAPSVAGRLADFRKTHAQGDLVDQRSELLEGGDPAAGKIVFQKPESMCQKCHMVESVGGVVGPDLSGIGALRNRRQLLESILLPNKEIAPEFRGVVLHTSTDSFVGRVLEENGDNVILLDAQGEHIRIRKTDIESRQQGLSAMPENAAEPLSPRDLRDVVAYLASLQHSTSQPH